MEVIDRIAVMNVSFIGSGRGRIKLTQERDKHYRPRVLKELFERFLNTTKKGTIDMQKSVLIPVEQYKLMLKTYDELSKELEATKKALKEAATSSRAE